MYILIRVQNARVGTSMHQMCYDKLFVYL